MSQNEIANKRWNCIERKLKDMSKVELETTQWIECYESNLRE